MKQKSVRRFVNFILAFILCMQVYQVDVMAATTFSSTSITAYTQSTERVKTYEEVNGAYSGYIEGALDECELLEIYENGWCKVGYPTARGKKEAFTQTSNFFVNTDFSSMTMQLGSNKDVYRRSDLSQKFGTVYGTDQIFVVGWQNGNTQIIYPLDAGGYKCGWISGTYSVNGEVEVDLKDGWYQICSAINGNYVIDVEGASGDLCANIMLYENNYGFNQVYLIKKQPNGYYTIMAVHSNLYFDVEKGGCTSGTNVLQYSLNGTEGSDNQLWKIYQTSDGYYRFQSKASGLFLDCNGGVAENFCNVQIWESNDTNAQKFALNECAIDGKTYEQTYGTSENASEEIIRKIVEFELSQIGVADYKGNNNVIYNTWYWGREINGSGYAWCQAFQSYAANYVGVLDIAIPKTASCSNAVSWFSQRGEFHLRTDGYTPKAGDLVFYGENGGSHVGMIIASPVDGYLQVVEGNVYDSNGNYSVQKFTQNSKRRVDSSYVYGYASPSYGLAE